jgi:ABC-2 type transport system permease protein
VKTLSATCIYVLWLREMKKFFRTKSRILGSLSMPFFFLAFLGLGLRGAALPNMPDRVTYLQYLVPGILGMSMLFVSMMAGLSVLWDREFGFLKEIMVAPVSRLSIVLGRTAGGITTAIIQAMTILVISMCFGFRIPTFAGLGLALLMMVLIASTFIGIGLAFASRMRDIQGFSLVWNFVIFPVLFLSGALYPLKNLPKALQWLSMADPLSYGVDALRWALLEHGALPLVLDLVVLGTASTLMLVLGAVFFETSESV